MKKTSKILAIIMVIAMLASFAVVPANAADLNNVSVKFTFKAADKATVIGSAKAGDIVHLFVSFKTDAYVQNFEFTPSFDATALKLIRQNGQDKAVTNANCAEILGNFADSGDVALDTEDADPIKKYEAIYEDDEIGNGTCKNWGNAAALSCTAPTESLYPTGYDSTARNFFKFVYAANPGATTLLPNGYGEYVEIVRLCFLVLKDVTFTEDTVKCDNTMYPTLFAIDSENIPFANLCVNAPKELAVSYAWDLGSAPAIIKASKTGDVVNTLVGWGNYVAATDSCDGAKTGKFNVAVKATFTAEDLAEAGISFTDGKCNEIATLNATVKIGDNAAQTASTRYIYGAANGKGAYEYYVVIGNIAYGAEDDVEITFGGTLAAGGAISGEKITINLKDAFDAAVTRGLPTDGYIPA